MAEVSSIQQFVSWGTRLTLRLYDFGASHPPAGGDVERVAKAVNLSTRTLKHVGAAIKDDDTVPSAEAVETLQYVLAQYHAVFTVLERIAYEDGYQEGTTEDGEHHETRGMKRPSKEDIDYHLAFLDSLRLTLAVMLQTFYTVKVVRWARQNSESLNGRAAETIENERLQMEVLIIEQQVAVTAASRQYESHKEQSPVAASFMITQGGEVQKVTATEDETAQRPATPVDLVLHHDMSLSRIEEAPAAEKPGNMRRVSQEYITELMTRWTTLHEIMRQMDFHDSVAAQREAERQRAIFDRRADQQPSVEDYDSAEERQRREWLRRRRELKGMPDMPSIQNMRDTNVPSIATPTPRHAASAYPLSPGNTLPIPVPGSNVNGRLSPGTSPFFGRSPTSPKELPGSSPRSFRSNGSGAVPTPGVHFPNRSPLSPRASFTAEKEPVEHDHGALDIPWRLMLRNNWWDFVDSNIKNSNTQMPVAQAYQDRATTTELLGSWVSKAALEEKGLQYSQIQKERVDHRGRSAMQPAFTIARALPFKEVERLVERTIEMMSTSGRESNKERDRRPYQRSNRPSTFERTTTLPSHTQPSAYLSSPTLPHHPASSPRSPRHSASSLPSQRPETPKSAKSARSRRSEDDDFLSSDQEDYRRSSSSRRKDSGHSSNRRERERERGKKSGDGSRDGSGSGRTGKTTAIVAGTAGLMALLEGLGDVL